MKKRYDDGGYIPKSIFNKEGTDIADVGDAKVMTEPSEEVSAPIKKAIPKSVSNPKEEKPRTTESGMSRGTRPKDPREMEAGMSRGARRDFDSLSRAVNREAKTSKAAQDDFRGGTTVFTTGGKPNLEKQKLYDAVDEKSGSSDKSAYKTDALATASRAAAAADRQRRIVREGDMKKGGAVKKMASGGSASSRADGIASRGKTRGKIC
jgi:hypothetical protein